MEQETLALRRIACSDSLAPRRRGHLRLLWRIWRRRKPARAFDCATSAECRRILAAQFPVPDSTIQMSSVPRQPHACVDAASPRADCHKGLAKLLQGFPANL